MRNKESQRKWQNGDLPGFFELEAGGEESKVKSEKKGESKGKHEFRKKRRSQ